MTQHSFVAFIAAASLVLLHGCGDDENDRPDASSVPVAGSGSTSKSDFCDDPFPDAGADLCMQCAQRVCCAFGLAGQCLAVTEDGAPTCFEESIGCAQTCRQRAEDAGVDADAGDDAGVDSSLECEAACMLGASRRDLFQCVTESECGAVCFQ